MSAPAQVPSFEKEKPRTRIACRGSRLSLGTKKDASLFFAVGLEPTPFYFLIKEVATG